MCYYIYSVYIYIHLLLYYLVVRRGWFGAYRVFIFPLSEDFQAISRLSGARVTIPSPTNYYILSMKDRYIYIYTYLYMGSRPKTPAPFTVKLDLNTLK